jgi:hypothetical protein
MQNNIYERRLRRVITSGLLLSITLLLTLTPVGLIPVPTPAGSATIAHIPAIIAGILEGPLAGLIVSFGFGFGTLITPLPMVTRDPLVLVLPRMFIGVVAYFVWAGLPAPDRRSMTIFLVGSARAGSGRPYEVSKYYLWLGSAIAVAAVAAPRGPDWMRRQETITVRMAAAAGGLPHKHRPGAGHGGGPLVTGIRPRGRDRRHPPRVSRMPRRGHRGGGVISALRQYNRRRKSNL